MDRYEEILESIKNSKNDYLHLVREWLQLVKYKKIDCFGDNFAIYLINNGYIIHGEIEVFKLDYELDKIWEFSGADILVTQDNKLPFLIDEDRIKIYDWNGIYYEIDLNGKLIYDTYKK